MHYPKNLDLVHQTIFLHEKVGSGDETTRRDMQSKLCVGWLCLCLCDGKFKLYAVAREPVVEIKF